MRVLFPWAPTFLCAVATLGHFLLPDRAAWQVVLHAGAGWIGCTVLVWLAALVGAKAWKPATAQGALAVVWLTQLLPGTLPLGEDGPANLTVVSANVYAYNKEKAVLVEEFRLLDADVVLLQEITPAWVTAFEALGYTHVFAKPQEDCFGQLVLSKLPFEKAAWLSLEGVPMADVTVRVDGTPVRLLDVHTLPPIGDFYAEVWSDQQASLAELVEKSEDALVLAGDFNATRHNPSFDSILDAGVRDAHAVVGRAAAHTWPANRVFLGMGLDHLLVSDGIGVVSVTEGHGAGSDHLPVLAALRIH